jgi:hypothetical protein
MPYQVTPTARARAELQDALCAIAHEILAQSMSSGVKLDLIRTITSYEHEPRLGVTELRDLATYKPVYANESDLAACALRAGYFRRAAAVLEAYATAVGSTR